MLNEGSEITGDDDVQKAVFKFVRIIEELDLKRHGNVWETPAGFNLVKDFLCIYSSVYQNITWSILFVVRRKTI